MALDVGIARKAGGGCSTELCFAAWRRSSGQCVQHTFPLPSSSIRCTVAPIFLRSCVSSSSSSFVKKEREHADTGQLNRAAFGKKKGGILCVAVVGRLAPFAANSKSIPLASTVLASEGSSLSNATEGDDLFVPEDTEGILDKWKGDGAPKPQRKKKKKKTVAEIRAAALGKTVPESRVTIDGGKKRKKKRRTKKAAPIAPVSHSEDLREISVEQLLRRGRKLLEIGSAKSAADYFSECIERVAGMEDKVEGLLGLTEALLVQSSHDAAWAAALEALHLEPGNPEALYWGGVTSLHLERFSEARAHLASARASCEKAPLGAQIERALADTDRCEKQSRGIFDLESFHTEHHVPHPLADYIGPIEIRNIVGKGRALTVTRDVKRGELLLVTKAVAVSCKEGRPPGKEVDTNAQDAQLAQLVYERVCVDPWVRAQVESMYDGTDRELSVPSLDLFRRGAHKSGGLNPDPGGLAPEGTPLTTDNGTLGHGREPTGTVSVELDLERIKRVKMYNAFSTETVQDILGQDGPKEIDEVGLWTLAGTINHSCLPTASYFVIDDMHVVFAVHDLAKGDEITQPYMAIAEPVKKRQRDARLNWKFTCRCARCAFEEDLREELAPANDAWQEVRDDGAELLRRAEEGGAAAEEAFRFFRERVDVVEATIGKMGVSETQRNWLRASYLTCYTRFELASEMVNDWESCGRASLACLDAAESVYLYYSFTIQHAAEVAELMLCRYGKESEEWAAYKQRMLRIVERSLNCLPKYAVEAIEEIETFTKDDCCELFSEEVCKW